MGLGRIVLLQLKINCRTCYCRFCCPVPWAAKHSSCACKARRDWLQQLRLMNNRVHVQHYANDAAGIVQVLFYITLAKFLHNS